MHVQYCPTHNMLADYFTKPLQGATFRKFRDAIMNCQFVRSDVHLSDHRSVLDPKHANARSHITALRLTQNQSEGAKELTQRERRNLLNFKEKDRKNQRTSHF